MSWLRLRQVALVARRLEPVLDDLRAVLGLEVAYNDPGVGTFGLENAVIPVGNQFLEVVAPVKEGTAGGRLLERRGGDGGYMVICHTDEHPPFRRRVEDLGIRTVLEYENDEYRCMQLHPKDTGGSFLEIDWQRGGEDPEGPWEPAGRDWQRARRTSVVDGITAVEVQAEDPAGVAARWAEVVGRPVEAGAIALDNAAVRFVPVADGRGDGLRGVDVHAVDAAAARSAAADRGLLGDDGAITICGTRFRLT